MPLRIPFPRTTEDNDDASEVAPGRQCLPMAQDFKGDPTTGEEYLAVMQYVPSS
jgi:hypothetical protein